MGALITFERVRLPSDDRPHGGSPVLAHHLQEQHHGGESSSGLADEPAQLLMPPASPQLGVSSADGIATVISVA
jgi:hypothetical protein